MTLPSVVRVFFAVELPPSTKEALGRFISSLKKKSKAHAIRWTRPENLHITLQFIAEAQSEHLPELIQKVKAKITGKIKKSALAFGKVHLFPNPYRPRVIVLDVLPQEQMALLSGLIGEEMKQLNYAVETRPFRGHLTLGRIKQPHGLDLGFLSEFSAPDVQQIDFAEVVLFRSEPHPEGSHYTVLEKIGFTE